MGRKKGTKQTESTKKKISESLKNYFTNLTEEDREKWQRLNQLKREVWKKYYKIIQEENNLKNGN